MAGGDRLRWSVRAVRSRILGPALAALLPTRCFLCEEPLGAIQRHGACPRCWSGLAALRPPVCGLCALPLPEGTDLAGASRGRCAACVRDPGFLDGVVAAVVYDAVARAFVLRAKFGGRPEILPTLGLQLARVLAATRLAGTATAVVPVPSLPRTRRSRGFDPALEIARPVARALAMPLRTGLLVRRGGAEVPAKRLGLTGRRRMAERSFLASGRLPGKEVLLVDDVMTTGATLGACAKRLREAGAFTVRAAVWARALPRGEAGF